MSMQRRQWMKLGLGLGLGGAAALVHAGQGVLALQSHVPSLSPIDRRTQETFSQLVWHERAMIGFGTTLWLRAGHANVAQLDAALEAAVKALRDVETEMSLFNPDSTVSRLNATGVLHKPSAHLRSVLSLSAQVSRRSAGAFDVSMQPLWKVWAEAQAAQQLPAKRAVMQAQKRVNWQAVEVTPDAVRLNLKGMGVSLNGIAQGYAADVVKAVLQAHGIAHAQIDAGETALLGQAPGGKPWTLAVEDVALTHKTMQVQPHRSASSEQLHLAKKDALLNQPVVQMDGRAIATSSDAHTAFSADHRHHHILNPHTGYSPAHWASVSVLAPSCVLADALTKVFFMQSPQQLHATAKAWGVDVLAQRKSGEWVATAGVPLGKPMSHS